MGWDDMKAKEQEQMSRHFELAAHARKAMEVWWTFCFDCVVVLLFLLTSKQREKKLYTKWWMSVTGN